MNAKVDFFMLHRLSSNGFFLSVSCMLPLLKRGIGLHHGGLLPIVKEVIEILFQVRNLEVPLSDVRA